MFNNRMPQPQKSPIKTLVGMTGIIFGAMFLLQAYNVINLSFYLTNALYMKIFAAYAILSGIMLVMNIQRHGIIRY